MDRSAVTVVAGPHHFRVGAHVHSSATDAVGLVDMVGRLSHRDVVRVTWAGGRTEWFRSAGELDALEVYSP